MGRIETPTHDAPEGAAWLGDVVQGRRDQIVADWMRRVRALPHAHQLDRPRLVDYIPELLDEIASAEHELARGSASDLTRATTAKHTFERLEEGFDLGEIIAELGELRQAVLAAWEDLTPFVPASQIRVLDEAIDASIASSLQQFSSASERTLRAFDRIARASYESRSLEDLLQRLLDAMKETTPSIDTSMVYLREGDVLQIRAAVGLPCELEERPSLRIGEGFAGVVAARRAPMTLQLPPDGRGDGAIVGPTNMRVLYGVPIFDGDELVAVAKMGSMTAATFSPRDERVFNAMVERASAAILQQALRERAERAAAQLREREREFRGLADNISQLAWMADESGEPFWFNRRWVEFTGLSCEASIGDGWRAVRHPEHRVRVAEGWQRALATGEPWEDTFPMRGSNGYYRWFLSRAIPLRDPSGRIERWFGTNTDVTARLFVDEATAILSRSLDYTTTLDQLARLVVPDLADWCVVDVLEDGELRHVAIAHSDPSKIALAREFARRYPHDPERDRGTERVLRSGRPELDIEITDEVLIDGIEDPEYIRALRQLGFKSWIGAPLVARGRTVGVLSLIMSESNRRYGEPDLALAADLGQRAGAAVDNARLHSETQKAVRVREEVLAIVSHDLRNPLGAIDLGASLLEQTYGRDPSAAKQLGVIRRSADRMAHLIDDLLDMASINAGRLSLAKEREDVIRMVIEVLDQHEPLARERGIQIVRHCDPGSIELACDRNRLVQVFGNLLSNALKFCGRGDTITLSCRREDSVVRFVIEDTGPGINPADLPHIFEPYWSGRGGRKQGTGLGLFISKGIIEAHGGRLTAHSEPGRGARFAITLPIT